MLKIKSNSKINCNYIPSFNQFKQKCKKTHAQNLSVSLSEANNIMKEFNPKEHQRCISLNIKPEETEDYVPEEPNETHVIHDKIAKHSNIIKNYNFSISPKNLPHHYGYINSFSNRNTKPYSSIYTDLKEKNERKPKQRKLFRFQAQNNLSKNFTNDISKETKNSKSFQQFKRNKKENNKKLFEDSDNENYDTKEFEENVQNDKKIINFLNKNKEKKFEKKMVIDVSNKAKNLPSKTVHNRKQKKIKEFEEIIKKNIIFNLFKKGKIINETSNIYNKLVQNKVNNNNSKMNKFLTKLQPLSNGNNSETSDTTDIGNRVTKVEYDKTYLKSNISNDTQIIYNDDDSDDFLEEEAQTEFLTPKKLPLPAQNRIKKINLEILLDNEEISFEIVSFVGIKDSIVSLSLVRISIRKIVYENIKRLVLNSKSYSNKIKRSIFIYSKLSKEKILKKTYNELLYRKRSKYEEEINKDLNRTFPDNPSFKEGSSNYTKLNNVLKAYSNFNHTIGYAQGLNFIAGHSLLAFEKEEENLIFIDGFIKRFKLEELIGISNKLNSKINHIGNLLKKHTPEIYRFLEKKEFNHEFFTVNWILTVFSLATNTKFLFHIWDFMILFGWKFFDCFIICVLKYFTNQIINSEQSQICNLMKNLLKSERFENNFEAILTNSFEMLISK